MKHRKKIVVATMSIIFIAVCLQLPIAAMAADSPVPTPAPVATAEDSPVLTPERAAMDATTSSNAEPTASSSEASAQTSKTFTLRAMAAKKFDAGQKLSAEEYRSLGAGCVGFEAHHTFFDDVATITIVYKDSPADKAGIRVGDKIIQPEKAEDEKSESDPIQSRQKVKCGQAGTRVDVTVLRNGQPETITLVRMNIEDIQEPEYRQSWEQILRRLGYPQEGNFSGTSLKTLTPAPQ